ncbi:hypothetical protein LCGC14_0356100 [marine sediment metagenome]|uniref:Uncharacterized protein n=1 Tax=marine sediment metagenome TaxID=412755 RepID=A0A0F9WHL2_9ZZZZ
MNRRQFFRRVSATCAAAVVAPVVMAEIKKVKPSMPGHLVQFGRGNRSKMIYIHDEFSRLDPKKFKGWKNYAAVYDPSLATAPALMKVKTVPDRSVMWGRANWDWEPGHYVVFNCELPHRNITGFYHTISAVCVKAVEPIKKGQALIWNPDGTVRGA